MQLLLLYDNEEVVYVINKMTSSEFGLMSFIRKLTVSLTQLNTVILAKRVPGNSNVIAGMLSRFQDTPQILGKYGPDSVPSVVPQELLPLPL